VEDGIFVLSVLSVLINTNYRDENEMPGQTHFILPVLSAVDGGQIILDLYQLAQPGK